MGGQRMFGLVPLHEAVARICHEANRALCASLGDLSQKPWAEAPEWQRDSARQGVAFLADHPHAGPNASHESWQSLKESLGWKWGPVKDEAKLEHPCMVPYHELPPEQQAKDALFHAVVRAML